MPSQEVEQGVSAEVAESVADLEAEFEEGRAALAVGRSGGCAPSMPAGMELVPGFEDTIDSHFMAALLQEGADSQRGVDEVGKGAGEGGEGQNDGGGIDLSLGLTEARLKGCVAPPTATATTSVAASIEEGSSALPEDKRGKNSEHVDLAKEGREEYGGVGSSIDDPSVTSDGLEMAWRSDGEEGEADEGEAGGATPMSAQLPSAPAAPAESADASPAAAAAEATSTLPPPRPPLPPQPMSATVPRLQIAAVAEAAAAPPPPLPRPSPTLPSSVTPPVIAPACDAALGAEKTDNCRATKRGETKRKEEEQLEDMEKKEPRKRKPAAAKTPHKTARERNREAARAAAAAGKKKAAPVTAHTGAGIPAGEGGQAISPAEREGRAERGIEEPCPDVAASHRTVHGGLGRADDKGVLVGGGLGTEGGAPLQKAMVPSSSSPAPGVGAPGGGLDEASFDASASVSGGELPSVAEPRPLPRKVSLRFVPRDQATKDRVAERGYIPFQKLTAPVSSACDARRLSGLRL